MKRYRIIVTPSAANDISRAYEWLKAERPRYAEAWLDEIRERILGLETLPESHAPAPESAAFDSVVRQVLFGRGIRWRIFFTVEGSTVQIVHVRHGRRDYWLP